MERRGAGQAHLSLPVLKISLSIATSAQRPKGPLMRKAIDVIRDIVRQEIRSGGAPMLVRAAEVT